MSESVHPTVNPFTCRLATLACSAALGFLWARYTASITAQNVVGAVLLDGLLVAMSGWNVFAIARDPKAITYAVLGSMLGTWLAVAP